MRAQSPHSVRISWALPLVAAGLVVFAAGCPAQEDCNPSTCTGCCDADGTCQPGSLPTACGASGGACFVCGGGLSCVGGACQSGGGGGKTDGGGGTDAGGNSDAGGGGTDGGGQSTDGGADGGTTCACTLPNSQAVCTGDGGCEVDACEPGFRDRDGVAANGCESNCAPLVVSASGSLDVNLRVVQVSGRVTLQGASAPTGTPRGTLRFLLAESEHPLDVALPGTGEAVFSARLLAGTYRVSFVKSGDCRPEALPCGEQVLHEALSLQADGAMDLDVKRVGQGDGGVTLITVSGEVRRNAAQLPASTNGQSRGQVLFLATGSGAPVATANLGPSGAATYSVQLLPGAYDIAVRGAAGCTATSGPLPCYQAVQRKAFTFASSGSLNLDVNVVTLGGSVTLAGQAMPAHPSGQVRGRVELTNAADEGPAPISLGSSGAATYSALLYAGTYDVFLRPPTACTAGPLPCQSRKLRAGLAVTASGAADFDVKVARISGKVLANGADLAASPRGMSRGALTFSDADGALSVALSSSGAATYSVLAYAGTYAVSLSNGADCPDGPLPCLTRQTHGSLPLTADGVLDVNVPVAAVTGEVRANGAVLPNSPTSASRGTLTFTSLQATAGEGAIVKSLSASGAASFSVTAYPGNYQVDFANKNDCPAGPAPCQALRLEESRSIAGGSSLVLELPVVEVTGTLTVDGAVPTAASTGSRGTLEFRGPGAESQQVVSAALPATGAATYRARLFSGSYDLFVRNNGTCPPGALPCQLALVQRQRALTASGALSLDLPTATLSGTITVNGQAVPASPSGKSRGALRFGMWEASGGPAEVRLSPSGAATWTLRLARGEYDMAFLNDTDCPTGALPCQQVILYGCGLP